MSEFLTFEQFLTTPFQDLEYKDFMLLAKSAKKEIQGLGPERIANLTREILVRQVSEKAG
jgi:hypothetical protein